MIDKYNKFYEEQGLDYNSDIDDDIDDDDMEHLKYLLRTMFKNKGFDSISITNHKLDISIRCILSNREKLSDLIALFDIINKLKSDILPEYLCEFDMWYNKAGQTLEFEFLSEYGDGDDDIADADDNNYLNEFNKRLDDIDF